ncbi:hypothetical protein ACFRAE_12925 [Sphingobacterium sp. HJSM2_6]|uniref:hypothetical protein n=1 Tax=Sphingobacterium sp. HJSM2_6 TaxID=3366264 RepID=UPI003BBA2153
MQHKKFFAVFTDGSIRHFFYRNSIEEILVKYKEVYSNSEFYIVGVMEIKSGKLVYPTDINISKQNEKLKFIKKYLVPPTKPN